MTASETAQREAIVERVRMRLAADGLDAYLAYTPPNNLYCAGFVSWFAAEHWRFHGANLTLIAADPAVPPAMMVPEVEVSAARRSTLIDDIRGFGMWIETRELGEITTAPEDGGEPLQRPTWSDPDEQDRLLREMLGDRGLLGGRIGTDVAFAMADSLHRFRGLAPDAQWVDWTDEIFDLRAVKQPFEIDRLTRATELQENGFTAIRENLRAGMSARHVRNLYTRAVLDAANADDRYADFDDSWAVVSPGGPQKNPVSDGLESGDLVTIDGGVRVGGYKSDGARTFAIGEPGEVVRDLYDALLGANDRAVSQLVPGAPVADAFHAAEAHMHAAGYPQYSRGQYGHSLGLEQFPEEPPFIARDEHRPVQAGMVFAVEAPFYGADLGAITIEDMVLVTEDGPERMHSSPRELVVVG